MLDKEQIYCILDEVLDMKRLEIVNIVASAKFPFKFDLDKIAKENNHICNKQKNFPALNLKLNSSDLCQVFANGNVIVLGEKTIEGTNLLFETYSNLLGHLGYECRYGELKIQNIIARYTHFESIDLVQLANKNKLEFEPELFPAVRYRLEELNITINIFRTGKCMLLGSKNLADLLIAESKLRKLLNGEGSC
jgi:transcription initiation factor TFIID TATA-box-binding protein